MPLSFSSSLFPLPHFCLLFLVRLFLLLKLLLSFSRLCLNCLIRRCLLLLHLISPSFFFVFFLYVWFSNSFPPRFSSISFSLFCPIFLHYSATTPSSASLRLLRFLLLFLLLFPPAIRPSVQSAPSLSLFVAIRPSPTAVCSPPLFGRRRSGCRRSCRLSGCRCLVRPSFHSANDEMVC